MFKEILLYAHNNDCSDIHLVVDKQPTVRKVGELIRLDLPKMQEAEVYDLICKLLSPQQLILFKNGNDIDTAYSDDLNNRYRLNIYRQNEKYAIAMRLLKNEIPTIDKLELPEMFKSLAVLPRGLILVTGPTGSGKSTTLAAMINHVNRNKAKHILTLEDPIEYLHPSEKSMVNQREIGRDVLSFQAALKSAMREDPDVILVGEMRDHETISLTLTAAETGHLVFSTLHTTGAANTIDRIIDVFPPHQQAQIRTQLSGVLKAVISQALVPNYTNQKRLAVFEIMLMTDAIANLIRENKVFQIETVIQTSARIGMQTLDSHLVRLIKDQMITRETAYEYCKNQDNVNKLLTMSNY